jgi:hypothetical protein
VTSAQELHRGGNPRIEEFVRLVAAGDRHELLQCLIAECVEWQLCRGTEPQLAELLARFPDREDVVKAGFKAGTAAFESQKNAARRRRTAANGTGSTATAVTQRNSCSQCTTSRFDRPLLSKTEARQWAVWGRLPRVGSDAQSTSRPEMRAE